VPQARAIASALRWPDHDGSSPTAPQPGEESVGQGRVRRGSQWCLVDGEGVETALMVALDGSDELRWNTATGEGP
jgi:hypothetical protein